MFIGAGRFEKLLLEIKQEVLDKTDIENSISKLDKRPFSSLFEGKGDRFLVKIYNKEFYDTSIELGLDPKKFNIEDGYYLGEDNTKLRYGSLFKLLRGYLEDITKDFGNSDSVKNIIKLKHMLQQRTVFSYALFSRHPIDVIRMSDIGGITSCHSVDGGYFDCAKIESKNSGGIVFEIDLKDAKWVSKNLDKKEIFFDDDRGVQGISAISRVRLRRFFDVKKMEDYAIPEHKFYSRDGSVSGHYGAFAEKVLSYCKKNQNLPDPSDIQDPNYVIKNIYYVGGYQIDTDPIFLLKSILPIMGNSYYRISHLKTLYHSTSYILNMSESEREELISNSTDEELGQMISGIIQMIVDFSRSSGGTGHDIINDILPISFPILERASKKDVIIKSEYGVIYRDKLHGLAGALSERIYLYFNKYKSHPLKTPDNLFIIYRCLFNYFRQNWKRIIIEGFHSYFYKIFELFTEEFIKFINGQPDVLDAIKLFLTVSGGDIEKVDLVEDVLWNKIHNENNYGKYGGGFGGGFYSIYVLCEELSRVCDYWRTPARQTKFFKNFFEVTKDLSLDELKEDYSRKLYVSIIKYLIENSNGTLNLDKVIDMAKGKDKDIIKSVSKEFN